MTPAGECAAHLVSRQQRNGNVTGRQMPGLREELRIEYADARELSANNAALNASTYVKH